MFALHGIPNLVSFDLWKTQSPLPPPFSHPDRPLKFPLAISTFCIAWFPFTLFLAPIFQQTLLAPRFLVWFPLLNSGGCFFLVPNLLSRVVGRTLFTTCILAWQKVLWKFSQKRNHLNYRGLFIGDSVSQWWFGPPWKFFSLETKSLRLAGWRETHD